MASWADIDVKIAHAEVEKEPEEGFSLIVNDRDGQYEEWEAGFLDSADEFGYGGCVENKHSVSTF